MPSFYHGSPAGSILFCHSLPAVCKFCIVPAVSRVQILHSASRYRPRPPSLSRQALKIHFLSNFSPFLVPLLVPLFYALPFLSPHSPSILPLLFHVFSFFSRFAFSSLRQNSSVRFPLPAPSYFSAGSYDPAFFLSLWYHFWYHSPFPCPLNYSLIIPSHRHSNKPHPAKWPDGACVLSRKLHFRFFKTKIEI